MACRSVKRKESRGIEMEVYSTLSDWTIYTVLATAFGIGLTLLVQHIVKLPKKTGGKIGVAVLLVLAAFLVFFSISWGYASFIEGEPQAASIGFLVFGGLGLVFGLIGIRVMLLKPKDATAKEETAAIDESEFEEE